jgi:hypothetical protein
MNLDTILGSIGIFAIWMILLLLLSVGPEIEQAIISMR